MRLKLILFELLFYFCKFISYSPPQVEEKGLDNVKTERIGILLRGVIFEYYITFIIWNIRINDTYNKSSNDEGMWHCLIRYANYLSCFTREFQLLPPYRVYVLGHQSRLASNMKVTNSPLHQLCKRIEQSNWNWIVTVKG